MKKGLIKVIVLAAVFLVSLVVSSYMTNYENDDLTSEMKAASLPVIVLQESDTQINELHGYTTEMDAKYMRDTITPLDEDRTLDVVVQTYNNQIDGISYEVRSLDTERLIEDTEVMDYSNSNGRVSAQIQLQNLLEENEEYLLILTLKVGKQEIYYYTRVMKSTDAYVDECVQFALDFHETTFNEETASTLSTYLEPNATADNTTLNKVTINSTMNQVAWADFEGERLEKPVPSVKEINSSYNVIVLDYVMAATGENGELEYFNVEESYRVRYTKERMYLLDFERTMTQIFRGENDSFYDNYVQLGIRDTDVEYMANENGTSVLFVQEGELWYYNALTNQEAQVFSFRGFEGIDIRENYNQHDIKLIQVDESGNADFIVYGYMNRGTHEGQVGISVYHYNSSANTIEEEAFIPSNQSYQVMKENLGKLLYTSKDGHFYLMVEGTLYQIRLDNMDVTALAKNVEEGTYCVSESGRFFAWKNQNDEDSELIEMDLEDASTHTIEVSEGESAKPLCFMGDDLVYGIARTSDISIDAAGNQVFPMYHVNIMDSSYQVEKEYERAGYYISSAYAEDYTIYLNRVQYNGTAYVAADQDTIMNNEGDSLMAVTLHSTNTEVRQTQIQIMFAAEVEMDTTSAPKLLTPKEVLYEDSREVALDLAPGEGTYFAYANGKVLCATKNTAEAVNAASAQMGVVVDENQRYIWKRARNTTTSTLIGSLTNVNGNDTSMARALAVLLEKEELSMSVDPLLSDGNTPMELLNSTLKDATILDLTGCTVEETLYYISQGNPVFAMTGAQEAVLIVGFDASNVTVYQPSTNATSLMGLQDAATAFSAAGNVFIAYIK